MTLRPWYSIYSRPAGLALCLETILSASVVFGVSESGLLDMAHIQNGNLKGLLFLQQNSITFFCLLSVSLLSYSEFNEGRRIKGSLWFAG